MAYIGQDPFQEFTNIPTKDDFTGDGSTVAFDMNAAVPSGAENMLEVYVDNVRQEPGSGKAFTLGLDGNSERTRITFSAAPANGASIYVINDKTNTTAVAPLASDLNGTELILDPDGDTSITADSDDRIDFKIGGVEAIAFSEASGDTIIQIKTDAKDLMFRQFDGRDVLEINDAGFVGLHNGGTGSGQLRIYEDDDNGANFTAFQVGTQSGDITYTLPTADGSAGTVLKTNGSGVLSFGSANNPTSADGQALGTSSLEWSDLFLADSSTIQFGADQDTILTHTDGSGLTLNSTNKLMFNDASQFIQGASATVLDIAATDEIELTATLIDVVGNFTNSGTIVSAGVITAPSLVLGSTAVTTTPAELNLIDGGATVGTTAVADGDGILHNDGGSMKVTSAATFKTYFQEGISQAYDDFTIGDAAVLITTSSGNITIDAAASDSDIILKGTDGGADTTFLTIDGSAAGEATFNAGIVIADAGNIGSASDKDAIAIASDGVVTMNQIPVLSAGLNVSGGTIAGTLSTAAQTNITSVGTLTALAVDNITINGNDISSTAGTDLTITPLSGQQIVLDGTIVVDAGVVTGATSITSTAFVGDITGDVTGTADVATVATTVTVTDNEDTNENNVLTFVAGADSDGGNVGLESDGNLTYNPSTGTLSATNLVVTGTQTITNSVTMNASNAVVFEGSTADAHETTLTTIDATGDRTISLPNVAGTLPVLAAVSATAITSTPEELNILDGATVVVGEINALDIGSTAVGTAVASKAVILDSNKDYTGIRNLTISGEIDAATGDFSGAVDVAGALTNGSTLVSTGKITSDAGIDIDNFNIDGTTIALSSGDMTLDAAGDIVLDADGGDVNFLDGGTKFASIELNSTEVYFEAHGSDHDVKIRGNDGGTTINMLSFDTSAAGKATFNDQVVIGDGKLVLNSTAVTSTAAELNILDGVTATAGELNLIDGGTSRGTTALADGDGILINDAGTMRMTTVQTVKTYMASEPFASGTDMIFFQAAAPTGWTKSTANNNKALRVVSGDGGGTGGNAAFSSPAHNLTAAAHTIATNELPSHSHGSVVTAVNSSSASKGSTPAANTNFSFVTGISVSTGNTGAVGGGAGHTHNSSGSITTPLYIDVIVAAKD